ncbi:MAG: hypothetical protein LBU84_01405 [Prevotella sp.]|jgi:hypothetical protein|nr:hypothetical protein [Prevotella sp.]
MKTKLAILLLGFLLALSGNSKLSAQVTVGDDESPLDGALLQLKDKSDVTDDSDNATKGFAYPRVKLEQRNQLYPMYKGSTEYASDKTDIDKQHTGLTVYNTFKSADTETNDNLKFQKGLYIWTGTRWESVGAPQVENGLNIDNQSVIRLGGTLNQDTEIDQDGNTLTIASDKDLLYITGLSEGSQDDSRAMVVDINTGKVGTAPSLPAVLTFVQSETIYTFNSGSNGVAKNQTMSTTSSIFNTNLNTGLKVVVPFTNADIVTNNKLTSFNPTNSVFTLLEEGNVEISGYINYSCGNSGTEEVLLNLTLQVRENTSTPEAPAYTNDWEDYSSVRAVWVEAQPYYRNTLMVPPAIYDGKKGDQIRMVVVRPYDVSGTTATFLGGRHGINQSYEVSFTIPWGTKFSRGLKIIAQ